MQLDGPFRGSEALAAGVLTPGRLRGPGFRRLFDDIYAAADVPGRPRAARAGGVPAGGERLGLPKIAVGVAER